MSWQIKTAIGRKLVDAIPFELKLVEVMVIVGVLATPLKALLDA